MAVELATAYITLIPSMKGAKGAVEGELGKADTTKAGKKAGGKFSAGMKKGFAGLGAAFAVQKIGGMVTSTISAASDFNETASKTKVIFGENAGAIDAWASTAATNLGLSKSQALEAAAGFGDMFLQLGFSGSAATDMSKSVVQMSTDLGSFNNLPTEDVADRMSAAFRGEYDSLQALIPNINGTRVEQEALAKTGKKSAKELTAQEKAAAVLAIVQKDGANSANDFAETNDGLANSSKIITAQFADLKVTIGQKLLPIVAKATAGFADLLGWFQKNPAAMKALAIVLGGVLAIALGAAAAAAWAFTAALLANPATWIAVAIIAAVAGIILVIKNWGKIADWLKGIWDAFAAWIGKLWDGIVSTVKAALKAVADFFRKVWGGLVAAGKAIWRGIVLVVKTYLNAYKFVIITVFKVVRTIIVTSWNAIRKVASTVWNGITSLIRKVVGGLKTIVSNGFGKIKSLASSIFNGVKTVISNAWQRIKEIVRDGADRLVDFVKDIPARFMRGFPRIVSRFTQLGSDMASGLINAVRNGLANLVDIVTKPIKAAIDKAKDLIKPGSPSKVTTALGNSIVDGFMRPITSRRNEFAQGMARLVTMPAGVGATSLRASAAAAGGPADADVLARIAPEDIRALGEYILAGSSRMARGELVGLGRGLRAGVQA